MQKTKKAKVNSTHESIRIQQLVGLKSWPWRTARYLTIAAVFFLSGLMFMQFANHQIGYAQIDLPGENFQITVDDNKPFNAKSTIVNIGPLMQGRHQIKIKDKIKGGININMASIIGGDTLHIKPTFIDKQLNPQILIQTDPLDAYITIDDRSIDENIPENLNISPGRHEILVSHPEYESMRMSIQMQSGQNYNLQFSLIKR